METKITAYRYYPWKIEKYVGPVCGALLVAASIYLLVSTSSAFDISLSIFSILFFGLAFLLTVKSCLKPRQRVNLSTSSFVFRCYKKYNNVLFIIISGGIYAVPLMLISISTISIQKGVSSINVPWGVLAGIYIPATFLTGFYRLKRLQYIERTGSPVYDLSEDAKTTEP